MDSRVASPRRPRPPPPPPPPRCERSDCNFAFSCAFLSGPASRGAAAAAAAAAEAAA